MKTLRRIFILVCGLSLLAFFTACEEQGPMEEAGENVDEAIESTQETMEEAGENVQEGVEEVGEEVQEAGEEMQQ